MTTPHTPTDTITGEEATAVVTRPAFTPPAPAAQGPVPGYGGYGAPQYGGPGVPPPPYGPHHVVPGAFPAPKRGLARVPRAAWLAAAAALTLVVILVAVVVANSGGGATSASSSARSYAPTTTESADGEPATLITSAQLPGMLLNPTEIADSVGQPDNIAGAKPSEVRSAPYLDELIAGRECLPLAYTAEQVTYQGTGFTAMRAQSTAVRTPNEDARSWVFHQGVIAYPSRDAAEKTLLTNIGKWKACENTTWGTREKYEGGATRDVYWAAGAVQQIDTLVVAPITQENGDGWGCWRGITLTGNVVVDYTVCGQNLTPTAATQAAAAITGKAPAS